MTNGPTGRQARAWTALLATVAIVAGACSGAGATPTPPAASPTPQAATPTAAATATPPAPATATPTAAATATPTEAATASPTEAVTASPTAGVTASAGTTPAPGGLLVPTIDLTGVGGPGEGELNLIIWAGYAENGENQALYDWVHPFEDATGCKVSAKAGNSSDEMVTLMRQGGGSVYDGVSASGDASNRLISAGDLAEVDTSKVPGFSDLAPFMQDPPHNTVDGKHYGVSHGWGGNLLLYNTEKVTPAPTSWDIVFDPAKAATFQGGVTAYNSPIYIADAALYLKAHSPELGITDAYELTQPQFDAAVALLKQQRDSVAKYWISYPDEIENFTSGTSVVGQSWPYQLNTLKASGVPVAAVVPTEGMTGWADTWMMSAHAKHQNCMLKWMAWMITPEIQTQVAESFGEAPANPKACAFLDKGYGPYAVPDFCTAYSVNDKAFYEAIGFWKTPQAACGDDRGETCIDYSVWTQKWTEIIH